MTRVGILGDLHGNSRWAVSCLDWFVSQGISEVYQVGDMGIWPGYEGESYLRDMITACEELGISLLIVPGNHEDYTQIEDPETDGVVPHKQVLARGKGWEVSLLPRGYLWEVDGKRFVAFGGAPSIDFESRKEGKSWWPEEMIRESDLLRLSGDDGIDVMLCHDAPDGGTAKVQAIIETPRELSFWSDRGLAYAAEGRELMNRAYDIVKPKWFIHGHYHVADYRYDSVNDRHYVSMDMDGLPNNVGVLSWDEEENEDIGMSFRFYGGDSWV